MLAPTANAQRSVDATNFKLSSEQKEQIQQRLKEAQARITELREKSQVPIIDGLSSQKKLEIEDLYNKNRTELEEIRKKAEARIMELRKEASTQTDSVKNYTPRTDQGNSIGETVKQMPSGERSALFGEIIKRLQTIEAERGDDNPILKAAIEQIQKLRSQQ